MMYMQTKKNNILYWLLPVIARSRRGNAGRATKQTTVMRGIASPSGLAMTEKRKLAMTGILGGLLLLLLVHTSCNKLTESPYSSIFTDNFYKTASDAEAALTAVYGPMVNVYFTAGTFASDFSADQIYPRPVVGRDTYTLFSYDPNYTTQKSFSRQNESPQQIWQACYQGIEKANWVLLRVPATNMDTVRRSVILGEAYYMRAFYFWILTKNFRDIVVKTTPSTSIDTAIIGKTLQPDVFKQIFQDLDQAGDVVEGDRRRFELGGLEGGGDLFEPLVGHLGDRHVGLDRGERVVGGLRPGAAERVEQRGLARVGQPDDPDLHVADLPAAPMTSPSAAPAAMSDG